MEESNQAIEYLLDISGYNGSVEQPGLYTFKIEEALGSDDPECKLVKVSETAGAYSPSYCDLSGDSLYAACEMPDHGGLGRYDLHDREHPEICETILFGNAAGTCFSLVDSELRYIHGADYNSGSICESALDEAGAISKDVRIIQHRGHGAIREKCDPNFGRQTSPHVHTLSFIPGMDLLVSVDLGLDLLAIYQLDDDGRMIDSGQTCVLSENGGSISKLIEGKEAVIEELDPIPMDAHDASVVLIRAACGSNDIGDPESDSLDAGDGYKKDSMAILPLRPAAIVGIPLYSGPRIIAYHPKKLMAALVCELACKLMIFDIGDDGRRWNMVYECDLLEGVSQDRIDRETPLAAHCQYSSDARFLYVSTRGVDIISVLTLGEDGIPLKRRDYDCGGDTPRHFALSKDGRFLMVANQSSSDIVLFRRDDITGGLEKVASAEVSHPSCVVWR